MAGRGRVPPPMLPAGPGFGPGVRPLGPMGRKVLLPPSPAVIEEKLASQHAEIQRLLTENQRLAATHVALRQELAVVQQEAHRLQQVISGVQAEKEQQFRSLAENFAKMEAELRALEPFRIELQRTMADAQKLSAARQELIIQAQQLNQELVRARMNAQTVPTLKGEIENLRQEIQRGRTAFEFEKKANTDLLEQRGGMEKNLVSMAREVEKLRAELTNAEKKALAGYVGGFGTELASSYGEGYGTMKVVGAGEKAAFGAGGVSSWVAYGSGTHR